MNIETIEVWQLDQFVNDSSYEVYDEELQKWVNIVDSCYMQQGAGYAPISDPFNMVTSITISLEWMNQLITLAVPPPTLTMEQAQVIAAEFDNTFLFDNEVDMLSAFLGIIEDADVIAGWNSEGFDLPYLVNRIEKIMSKDDTRQFCLWGEYPKDKVVERYGEELKTYSLVGRTHLDLLEVYRKFTYEERHSYSLDNIAKHELGKCKTPYSGSLDELYKKDFKKFIEYNRQDVVLLSELELKLKFIALINGLAHDTTTLLETCMGTVATFDQAVINKYHDLGFIVPDKSPFNSDADEAGIAGAHVAPPKVGIHDWIGIIDINSLYPNTDRALNMGIETIIGQIKPTLTAQFLEEKFIEPGMTFAKAWEGQFGSLEYQAVMAKKPGIDLIIDWEHSDASDTITAEECYNLIFNSELPWMISGNGTIFTYEKSAIIPELFAEWYAIRQEYQKKAEELSILLAGIIIPSDILVALAD